MMCKSHHEIWQYRMADLVAGNSIDPDGYSIVDVRDIAECKKDPHSALSRATL